MKGISILFTVIFVNQVFACKGQFEEKIKEQMCDYILRDVKTMTLKKLKEDLTTKNSGRYQVKGKYIVVLTEIENYDYRLYFGIQTNNGKKLIVHKMDREFSITIDMGTKLDLAPYKFDEKTRMYGVRQGSGYLRHGNSWSEETLYLFKFESSKLKQVALFDMGYERNDVDERGWDESKRKCSSIIIVSDKKTKGAFDLIQKEKCTFIDMREEEPGENSDNTSKRTIVYKWNGKEYKQEVKKKKNQKKK